MLKKTCQNIFYPLFILLFFTALVGCAKQGMPTGGPKDETPPRTKQCLPNNRTLNFEGNSFYIEFDEYVVLKDADNNVLVSPPLKNKPDYKTKGRGIQVKINDTLSPNTTYLFQFKDAVADYNEGNILPTFEYVFSTGGYIDSMTLKGRAVDALSRSAREETMSVWLYDGERYEKLTASLTDTSIGKITPSYITRCDKKGNFAFNNIQPGEYHILAVSDDDKNLMPGTSEAIAFTSSPVDAHPELDTAVNDSLRGKYLFHKPIELLVFVPQTVKQRITGSNFVSSGKVQITTLLPMSNPNIDASGEETVWRLNPKRDTLTLWTLNEKCDSLRLTVGDASGLNDTLKLKWRAKKGRQTQQNAVSQLVTKLNFKTLPYYDTLTLLTFTPVDTKKCRLDSAVTVMRMSDSSTAITSLTIAADSAYAGNHFAPLKATVDYTFQQGEKYSITIAKGCLSDIYGHGNDSLQAVVNVTKSTDYGNLRVKVAFDSLTTPVPVIVDLLNEKGETVAQRHLDEGSVDAVFQHLTPGKYRVRAVLDSNGNGKWDTGNFATRQQPEKTLFLGKTLDIRANWDFEETLEISE